MHRAVYAGTWVLLCISSTAEAEPEPNRARVSGSLLVGRMSSSDQLGRMAYDQLGMGATLSVGYRLMGPFVVDARLAATQFFSAAGDGSVAEGGLGANLELNPWIDSVTFSPSVHVGLAATGDLLVPTVHVGLRVVYELTTDFFAGPEISLAHLFWRDGTAYSTDAQFWMAGLAVEWRPTAHESSAPSIVDQTSHHHHDEHLELRFELPPSMTPRSNAVEIDRLLNQALPLVHREEQTLIAPVLFHFDSTQVLPCGEGALYAARQAILELEGSIVIEGHADGEGTEDYNLALSRRRAEWVRDWLIARGVDAARLSVAFHGEGTPLTDESDERDRQLDRRVTFHSTRRVDAAQTRSNDAATHIACEASP